MAHFTAKKASEMQFCARKSINSALRSPNDPRILPDTRADRSRLRRLDVFEEGIDWGQLGLTARLSTTSRFNRSRGKIVPLGIENAEIPG
jgi:hypothetical protein